MPFDVSQIQGIDQRRAREFSRIHSARIKDIMEKFPNAFSVTKELETNGCTISAASPIDLARDTAIPLYIKHTDGKTRLFFAYLSESQCCWRRFAGSLHGIYWKGPSEHTQNFASSIQKFLDKINAEIPRFEMKEENGPLYRLSDLGLAPRHYADTYLEILHNIIIETESMLQSTTKTLDLDEQPYQMLKHWSSGSLDDVYGNHFKLLAGSEQLTYSILISDAGIFVQYAEDRAISQEAGELSIAGSPKNPVLPPIRPGTHKDHWVFTPLVEYSANFPKSDPESPKNGAHKTMIGERGGRIRIRNLHERTNSPIYTLYNGLRDVPRYMRYGHYDYADAKLRAIQNGSIPLISSEAPPQFPEEQVKSLAEERLRILIRAYQLYGEAPTNLNPDTPAGKEMMEKFEITIRTLKLFHRYLERHCGNFSEAVAERLGIDAVEWAKDKLEGVDSRILTQRAAKTFLGIPAGSSDSQKPEHDLKFGVTHPPIKTGLGVPFPNEDEPPLSDEKRPMLGRTLLGEMGIDLPTDGMVFRDKPQKK